MLLKRLCSRQKRGRPYPGGSSLQNARPCGLEVRGHKLREGGYPAAGRARESPATAGLGLGSYGSDASSDDEDQAEPYPLTQPLALERAEESEEESEEEEEAAGAAAEEEQMIGPVVPVALSGAVEESDEEEAQAPSEEDDDEQAPSLLPPPDFGNWDPEVRSVEAHGTLDPYPDPL